MKNKDILRTILLFLIVILFITYLSNNVNKIKNLSTWIDDLQKAQEPLKVSVQAGNETIYERHLPSGPWAGYVFVNQDIRPYLDGDLLKVLINDKPWETINVYEFEDFVLLDAKDSFSLAFIHRNYANRLKDLVLTTSLIRHMPYDLPLDQGFETQSFPGQIVMLENVDEVQAEDFPLTTSLQPGKTYQVTLSYQSGVIDPAKGYPAPVIKLQGSKQDGSDTGLTEKYLLSGDGAVIPAAVLISLPESWIEATLFLGITGEAGTLSYQDFHIDQLEGAYGFSDLVTVYLSYRETYNELLFTLVRKMVINEP